MSVLLFIAPAVCAALLAYGLTPLARRVATAVGAVDQPAPRKIHVLPMPRLGGLAVLVAAATVLALVSVIPRFENHALPRELIIAIAAGLLPIATISLLDDIRSQRPIVKFLTHLAGASIAVSLGICLKPAVHFFGQEVHIGWLAIPISIAWLAGITNAFNLIDGLDGLSAGLALISAASLAAVSMVTRHTDMAAAALILCGALIGFLPSNIYPAKIYLGDCGATTIGFFLGALTLSGGSTTSAGLAVTLPIVVLGIPLADTLVSMLRRLVRRIDGGQQGMFAADSNHIHHRLLALGFGHKRSVQLLYAIGILLAILGFASLFMTQQNGALLLAALLVAAIVGVSKLGYDEFAMVKSGAVLRMYDTPVLRQGFFVVFADLTMIAIALYVAVGLKYDDWGVTRNRDMLLQMSAIVAATTLLTFAAMRIYRRSWSNASIDDIVQLTTAVSLATAATYMIARFTIPSPPSITLVVTYLLVILALTNGSRASYRVFLHWNRQSNSSGDRVLIYGAGIGGLLALKEILANTSVPMKPIGFIDDDRQMKGRVVNGYPVLGTIEDLESVVTDEKAHGVIIASDKISIAKVQNTREVCDSLGAWMRVFSVNFHNVEGKKVTAQSI